MKILDEALVRDRYNVVVVGAGIGGLTAAALLAKRGLKTLVVEQHYIPGGCCTSLRRHGITFDVGAAMLFGWAEKGYNPHRFVMNELEEEIDMIPHESIYRIHLLEQGKTVTFWRDLNRFLDELTDAFPHQNREIRALYADFKAFYEDVIMKNEVPMAPTEIPVREGLKFLRTSPVGVLKTVKYIFQSEESLLAKYITDPKLMCLFDFLTATYTCCNVTESPAMLAATMFMENHMGGACYPSGSPQMLPNKLEKAIEKFGGQMLYRNSVEEILIWQGKAYGARLANGAEIMADCVVSDANVWDLYGKLINRRHINPRRLKWAMNMEPTLGTMLLYIGVKAECVPEGSRAIEFFAENLYDFNGPNYCVFIPSIDDPSIAPPGTHSFTVIAPNKVKWPRPDDPFYQSEAYYQLKQREADKVIDKLEERYFPNLRKSILCMEVGTPSTLERYTRKAFGSVGGPKLTLRQNFFNRLKARSDWKNLYCAGDSTTMGEGVIAATVSGVSAANTVLKDRGLKIFLPRKFPRQYVRFVKGSAWTPAPVVTPGLTEPEARRLSRDCQTCEKPACREACPAGIDVTNFLRRIEAGNYPGAVRSMRETNPLAEVCGHICPAERLCEKSCNRHDFADRPTRIAALQAWVCRQVPGQEGWERYTPTANGRSVAVVGAGPAGLSCAHFLARLGYRVQVLEKAARPGGMLSLAIPTFRLPPEMVDREIQGLTYPSMQFRFGQALGRDYGVRDLEREHDAVFLSPGLWSGRTLGLPGADHAAITDALALLTSFREKGKVKVKSRVLVIGGGSVAADAAMTCRVSGAEQVTMVCLEQESEMPALPGEVQGLRQQGVEILNGWGPREFLSGSRMAFRCCVSVFDENRVFAPSYDESRVMEREFDQVVLAVGQTPEPQLARTLEKEFGRSDRIEVDPVSLQVRGRGGVFAGGDIVRGAGTVVQAVADGRRAARAIDARLRQRS